MIKHKIIVAVTGASGSIYAKVLFEKLKQLSPQVESCGVVFSGNAKSVWQFELDNDEYLNIPFNIYDISDFNAPFASGSADRKSTRLNSSHVSESRMPSSA